MSGGWDPFKPDFAALLELELAAGRVHSTQLPKVKKPGFAYFDFVGGLFDEARLRLYPPFPVTLDWGRQGVYALSPPKNKRTKRLSYKLVSDESGTGTV